MKNIITNLLLTNPPRGDYSGGHMTIKGSPLHRLQIARGHLDKVIRMVQSDEYCIDVLTQSQAVQSALREVDALVLENHLQHCVVDAVKGSRDDRDRAITEVVKVFKKK